MTFWKVGSERNLEMNMTRSRLVAAAPVMRSVGVLAGEGASIFRLDNWIPWGVSWPRLISALEKSEAWVSEFFMKSRLYWVCRISCSSCA